MSKEIIPATRIAQSIYLLRGQKVMLDFDLAALYGVEARVLNQAVKRNDGRFPKDFMFQISAEEMEMISRSVISSTQERTEKK
ncbi:MAG: ORF6N domain-containing protein, partial [Chthoniobacterales bacterium]